MSTTLQPTLKSQLDWSVFLGRDPSRIGGDKLFFDKTVLISGAGGSIGSALTERLLRNGVSRLALLDCSAESLAALRKDCLDRGFDLRRVAFIHGNILDHTLLQNVFSSHRPAIVLHAAALKHLAPLEHEPFAALKTNLFGTINIVQTALQFGTERFVNVSTDKAVDPTSILGVSKRAAELFLLQSAFSGIAQSMRMGNALGSSGSVVPIFMEALRRRVPLEITDPQAFRYFVTLAEAADFILQSTLVDGRPLFLPEMGRPRRVAELAGFLAGVHGDDHAYPILYTALRDGEKQCERLTYEFEHLQATPVPCLYEICGNRMDEDRFAANLRNLQQAFDKNSAAELIAALLALVPEYTPSNTLLRWS